MLLYCILISTRLVQLSYRIINLFVFSLTRRQLFAAGGSALLGAIGSRYLWQRRKDLAIAVPPRDDDDSSRLSHAFQAI